MGPWATIGFGFAIGAAFLATQIIVVIIIIAVEVVTSSDLDVTQYVETSGHVLALCTYGSTTVCLVMIFLIIVLRKGATIKVYLALKPTSPKMLLQLTALLAAFIMTSDILTLLLGRQLVPQVMVEIYETKGWPLLFGLAIVIAGPAFEEIFFRGFLYEGLKHSRIRTTGAIILTSLLWTIMHIQYDAYELTTIFICGLMLGIVRSKTGSLWTCLFMHALMNLVATIEIEIYIRTLPS